MLQGDPDPLSYLASIGQTPVLYQVLGRAAVPQLAGLVLVAPDARSYELVDLRVRNR